MNVTYILVAVITVLGVQAEELCRRYLVPWLKQNNQIEAAKYAVLAAEAAYGSGHGKEKLKAALDTLKTKGFNIDSAEVVDTIEAAWKQLDIEQIAAGIKDPAK